MMSTVAVPVPEAEVAWSLPDRGRVGMYGLIAAEAAIFTIFVVAYLFYVGKSLSGPLPNQVLHAPIVLTICLLSSSLTIHLAVAALRDARTRGFLLWWAFTIALGAVFLGGTAREWHHLIYDVGLTIRTNLFGSSFFTLTGFHGAHVTAGVLWLLTLLAIDIKRGLEPKDALLVDISALYWHFVDVVWIAIFTLVYLIR